MTIEEIYKYADKIGLLTFSTIHQGEVHSRIAHLNGFDNEGIYFRTMPNKPYGRQLQQTLKVTICGHHGEGILNHENIGAVPHFAPGYSFRLVGELRFVPAQEIIEKAKNNPMLEVAARDIELYPAMANGNYIIHKAKGEIFDYDFEKLHRDHKVLRTRFAFGGSTVNPAGVRINENCIMCGACEDICSFAAIHPAENQYYVMGERCDDCGSCLQVCPVNAIEESLVM